jgi:hypothetical protein
MRRNIILIATVLYAAIGWAQTMNIHYKNGQTVQYNMNNIDYVEYTEDNPSSAQVSSGEAVDLGLSVLWASCNLGATSCEQMGDKYAWGETDAKEDSSVDNYIYYDSDTQSYVDIGEDISGTAFDAARTKWGKQWRIPTHKEMDELKNGCLWRWSEINNVYGFVITGSNGNSIFLPIINKSSYYWTSIIPDYEKRKASNTLTHAMAIHVRNDGTTYNLIGRNWCVYIRPVISK